MPSKEIRVSNRGGLGHLEYFLRLRPYENKYPPLDVVFVSIDLERAWIDEQSTEAPPIKEAGIAKLDTQELISATLNRPATKLVTTTQFSTRYSSAEFKDCHDSTEFRECLFAETFLVPQESLAQTIATSLRIQDDNSSDPLCLRNIVLVGHSIKLDLKVLLRLGVDFHKIAPTVAILDTHRITRHLLGPESRSLRVTDPMTAFKLSDVLTELECPFQPHGLHNAGNDAAYTLHALFQGKGAHSHRDGKPVQTSNDSSNGDE
jgi:hypothetical protein